MEFTHYTNNYYGKGGTQVSGGAVGSNVYGSSHGSSSGGPLYGGNGASSVSTPYSGSSGGGGYFGGGSGNNNNLAGGPGGGGSGFIHPQIITNGITSLYISDPDNGSQNGHPENNGVFILKVISKLEQITIQKSFRKRIHILLMASLYN